MASSIVRVLVLLSLVACNQVFGLGPTVFVDAAVGAGGGLFVPPDGTQTCNPRPSYETWSFASATIAFDRTDPITSFALYRAQDEVRAVVATEMAFYDVAPSGMSTHLAGLDAPQYGTVGMPRIVPGTRTFWFRQSGLTYSVFYAYYDTKWNKSPANLVFVNATSIEPGTPGFYGGTARMVVSVRDQSDEQPALYELSSRDGLMWTQLDTIRFASPGAFGAHDPFLTRDGCHLFFTSSSGFAHVYVVSRETDGTFRTPVMLPQPSMLSTAPGMPMLSPDEDVFWFASNIGGAVSFYRGTP